MDGIDVSRWQATLDVASVDADFVVVQASKGLANENMYWREQAEDALNSGKLLGFYHYAKCHDWEAEADMFIATVRPLKGSFTAWLDVEGAALNNGCEWCLKWLEKVAAELDTLPGIYLNGNGIRNGDWATIAQTYPLWLARYSAPDDQGYQDSPVVNVSIDPWDAPVMHQYTQYGKLPGYGKDLDLDKFYGTKEDWLQMQKGGHMTDSPLASEFIYNSKINTGNWQKIGITPHHMAGVVSAADCARSHANGDREASAQYYIGPDGDIVQGVAEKDRAWTSASYSNDCSHVTIEVSNSETGGDWPISQASWNALVDLCVDICQRNGIEELTWTGDTSGNLTTHDMFAATNCPGPYLKSRMGQLADEVNARLNGEEMINDEDIEKIAEATMWRVVGYRNKDANKRDLFGICNDALGNTQAAVKLLKGINAPTVTVDYDKLADAVCNKIGDNIADKVADKLAARLKE